MFRRSKTRTPPVISERYYMERSDRRSRSTSCRNLHRHLDCRRRDEKTGERFGSRPGSRHPSREGGNSRSRCSRHNRERSESNSLHRRHRRSRNHSTSSNGKGVQSREGKTDEDGKEELNCKLIDSVTKLLDVLVNKDNKQTEKVHINNTSIHNVVPEFDPGKKTQSVNVWLNKVNECALIYNWSDQQISHYALAKLSGLAKRWYEGLPSVLFTWTEWQAKLTTAFPGEENYGQMV